MFISSNSHYKKCQRKSESEEMIFVLDGHLDLYKGMKSTRKSKYVNILFLILKFL